MKSHRRKAVLFAGIDVQTRRGCPFAVIDQSGNALANGWLEAESDIASVTQVLATHARGQGLAVGIDAPRFPLASRRGWYWRNKTWSPVAVSDRGMGRHCEVVLSALGLASPQWTRQEGECPEWMRLGFSLFSTLQLNFDVYEVFPSASYRQLSEKGMDIRLDLANFDRGPKDMLDAFVAAATVREFVQGRGCEVGGGDGLGTIVLPRPLDRDSLVHRWPTATRSASETPCPSI